MIEITIPGLTESQCVIANILWEFEDGKDADAFIQNLPTKARRQEAKTIKDLMVLAAIEQVYTGIQDDLNYPDAAEVLKQFTL